MSDLAAVGSKSKSGKNLSRDLRRKCLWKTGCLESLRVRDSGVCMASGELAVELGKKSSNDAGTGDAWERKKGWQLRGEE